MAQVVECLSGKGKGKALRSDPVPQNKQTNKQANKKA
jgi:hypothetical protein